MKKHSQPHTVALLLLCSPLLVVGFATCVAAPDAPENSPGNGTSDSQQSQGAVTLDLNGDLVEGSYTVQIQVGTPPKTFEVVIDTGSSNLILLGDSSLCDDCSDVINQKTYSPSKSSSAQLSSTEFSVRYASGSLEAQEVQDKVAVGALPPISYTFGVMTHNANIQNILGLAYKSVAQPEGNPLTPYLDELVQQVGIADEFSIQLCTGEGSEITFGATDAQVSHYLDITEEKWYVISPQRLQTKDGKKLGKFRVPTVVDSGSTDLVVTSAMHEEIMDVLQPIAEKNGVDLSQGLIRTTADVIAQFPVLQVLAKNTEGQKITLDIAPDTYFRKAGGAGYILGISIREDQTLLGQPFLQNHFVVFDRANKRLGFGPKRGCTTKALPF